MPAAALRLGQPDCLVRPNDRMLERGSAVAASLAAEYCREMTPSGGNASRLVGSVADPESRSVGCLLARDGHEMDYSIARRFSL
jgi:hypothetical protein